MKIFPSLHVNFPYNGQFDFLNYRCYFSCGYFKAGPFLNVSGFNDWVQLAALPRLPISKRPPDPYRLLLPDICSIYFSHGDLNLENVVISDTQGSRRVMGVLDWEQAGWYPEYWEYCKLIIAGHHDHEWLSLDGLT